MMVEFTFIFNTWYIMITSAPLKQKQILWRLFKTISVHRKDSQVCRHTSRTWKCPIKQVIYFKQFFTCRVELSTWCMHGGTGRFGAVLLYTRPGLGVIPLSSNKLCSRLKKNSYLQWGAWFVTGSLIIPRVMTL